MPGLKISQSRKKCRKQNLRQWIRGDEIFFIIVDLG